MPDKEIDYRKLEEAISGGIFKGVRKIIHQGLYIDGKRVSLKPPAPPRRIRPETGDDIPVAPE